MNLTTIARMSMTLALAAGLALAAQTAAPEIKVENTPPAPAAKSADTDVTQFLDAMSAIGTIFTGAAATTDAAVAKGAVEANQPGTPDAATAAEAEAATANGEPTVTAAKRRSAKNSMILITGGAAAGAAIGQAAGKGTKGAIVGAAIGAAVGLVYDRATYKNPGAI